MLLESEKGNNCSLIRILYGRIDLIVAAQCHQVALWNGLIEQADWSLMFILSVIYGASDKERPEGEHNANDSDHI